jgi:hypothetical protein
MSDGISFLRVMYISVFYLVFTFVLFSILTLKAEKDYRAVKYSYDPRNLWGPPDMSCFGNKNNRSTEKANFNIVSNKNFSDLVDQDIIFQYVDNNGNVIDNVFNIYLNATLPPGSTTFNVHGLTAGFNNYNANGTSIYLDGYDSAVSWNPSGIASLFQSAFKGTNASTQNLASLFHNEQDLTYQINVYHELTTGISISSNSGSDKSSIFGFTEKTLSANYFSDPAYDQPLNIIDLLENNKVTVEKARNNTDLQACVDPSYSAPVSCNSLHFNKDSGLYCFEGSNCTTVCTDGEIPSADNNCGVKFCNPSGANDNNGNNTDYYQRNRMALNNIIQSSAIPTANDYTIKNENKKLSDLYTGGGLDDPQYQKLIFCAGTSADKNNYDDGTTDTPVANNSYKYTPLLAKFPNSSTVGNKVVLGFK